MSESICYKRVLLKLSGELLNEEDGASVSPDSVAKVANRVAMLLKQGVQIALVIGAGNIFRGISGKGGVIGRTTADYMGMLATAMNALAMRDGLKAAGVDDRIQSAIPMNGVTDSFNEVEAIRHLESGKVVIFTCGTGHPFFTTDTTAALRACEISADILLKATKVNGIYSSDPKKDPDAVRYRTITYVEALQKRLKIMDSTAFSLCMDNELPIAVFDFADNGVIAEVLQDDMARATLVNAQETAFDF